MEPISNAPTSQVTDQNTQSPQSPPQGGDVNSERMATFFKKVKEQEQLQLRTKQERQELAKDRETYKQSFEQEFANSFKERLMKNPREALSQYGVQWEELSRLAMEPEAFDPRAFEEKIFSKFEERFGQKEHQEEMKRLSLEKEQVERESYAQLREFVNENLDKYELLSIRLDEDKNYFKVISKFMEDAFNHSKEETGEGEYPNIEDALAYHENDLYEKGLRYARSKKFGLQSAQISGDNEDTGNLISSSAHSSPQAPKTISQDNFRGATAPQSTAPMSEAENRKRAILTFRSLSQKR